MMTSIDTYGENIVQKILAFDILEKSSLSDMDVDIFVLRYGHDWYFEDIGVYVGNKYRGKPYTEGAIRYRTKLIKKTLYDFLTKMDRIDSTLR